MPEIRPAVALIWDFQVLSYAPANLRRIFDRWVGHA